MQDRPHGTENRVGALDGLRAVAVAFVIGFHYFSRWTPPRSTLSLYPYGSMLAEVEPFQFGYLGVHLFFLVSGFVISLTLTRCATWQDFALRRFARLYPAMLLMTTLTFLVLRWVSPHIFTGTTCGYLISLTFIDPAIFRKLLGLDCGYLDGAYWSLWVEVRFYVLVAILYFVGGQRALLRNAALAMNVAAVIALLQKLVPHLPGLVLLDIVCFPTYAAWMISGLAFFFVWNGGSRTAAWAVAIEGLFINLWLSVSGAGGHEWVYVLGIYALFTAFVLRVRPICVVLNAPWLRQLGESSYGLYLIHQDVGVTLIAASAAALSVSGAASVVLAPVIACALGVIAIASYRVLEAPSRQWLVRLGTSRIPRAAPVTGA